MVLLPVESEACSRRFIRCQDTGCHPSTGRRTHSEDTNTKVRVPLGGRCMLSLPHVHASRPTVESRLTAYSNASKLAENVRVQIRRQHQASIKKGKYSRHSTEHHEVSAFQWVFLVSK